MIQRGPTFNLYWREGGERRDTEVTGIPSYLYFDSFSVSSGVVECEHEMESEDKIEGEGAEE